jgi:ABC-type amino acid transport substrate-binding protein
MQRLRERGHLVVAQFRGFRPGFFFYDDAEAYPAHRFPDEQPDPNGPLAYDHEGHRLIGYDIDLAYRIARALDVGLVIRREAEDFYAVCRMVARREADIGLSKLSVTYDRARYVRYTRPYCVLGTGLLINRLRQQQAGRGSEPGPLLNHPQATFGVIPGNSFRAFTAQLFPRAQRQDYPNLDAEFQATVRGEVLAMYHDIFELKRKLRQQPAAGLYARLVPTPGKVDELAIAVHPDDAHLLSFLNTFLRREEVAATADDVLDRYFPHGRGSAAESAATRDGPAGRTLAGSVTVRIAAGLLIAALVGVYFCLALWKGDSAPAAGDAA